MITSNNAPTSEMPALIKLHMRMVTINNTQYLIYLWTLQPPSTHTRPVYPYDHMAKLLREKRLSTKLQLHPVTIYNGPICRRTQRVIYSYHYVKITPSGESQLHFTKKIANMGGKLLNVAFVVFVLERIDN